MDELPFLRLHWIHAASGTRRFSAIPGSFAASYVGNSVPREISVSNNVAHKSDRSGVHGPDSDNNLLTEVSCFGSTEAPDLSAEMPCVHAPSDPFGEDSLQAVQVLPIATLRNQSLALCNPQTGWIYLEVPLIFATVTSWKDPSDSSEVILLTVPEEKIFLPLGESHGVWMLVVVGGAELTSLALRVLGFYGAIQVSPPPCHKIQQEVHATGATATLHVGVPLGTFGTSNKRNLSLHDRGTAIFKTFRFGDDSRSKWRLSELQREIACLIAVQGHPNIVQFRGVFMTGPSVLSLQMDYCAGGDLFDAVVKRNVISEQDAQYIMSGLMQALDHMHCQGFVHRDVTCQNVLLGEGGRPILGDLGLCAHLSDRTEMEAKRGSPGYAAPEVWCGLPYDTRADSFSAGAVLFFALSRQLPFEGKTVNAVYRNMLCNEVSFANVTQFSHVSSECKNFILGLLQKEPRDRLSSRQSLGHTWMSLQKHTIDRKEPFERISTMSEADTKQPQRDIHHDEQHPNDHKSPQQHQPRPRTPQHNHNTNKQNTENPQPNHDHDCKSGKDGGDDAGKDDVKDKEKPTKNEE